MPNDHKGQELANGATPAGDGTYAASSMDVRAFGGDFDRVAPVVSYAPALFDAHPLAGNIPPVEIDHLGGCCCPGCGGMPSDERGVAPGFVANDPANTLGGVALSAPSRLGDLADFLTTEFWTNFGTVPREFNLTGSGLNPKNGVLHYNVSGFSDAGGAGTDTNGISAARAELVRDVLDVFGEVLGISFVETSSSSTSFTDIFFKDTDAGSAYANSAGFSAGIQYSWINIGQDWSGGTSTYNDYTLQTIFHEVGHALGLGHQGLYNGSGSFPSDADFENDSWQATMMSYFSQNENTTIPASFAFLQTPMSVDWMALQDIYGDQSFNGTTFGVGNAFLGDTVYGFNTNITSATSNIWAEFANFANRTASTIIDAGGIDTLDFSGYSASQLINLAVTSRFDTAPSVSNIGGLTGNLTLAEGTVIENAIGGAGADRFFGNAAANVFTGNGGNDFFADSAGDDTYLGGEGVDTVDFLGLFSNYSFSISGVFLAVMDVATDLVENTVEFLSFDDGTMRFDDIFNGLNGNTAPAATADSYATDEATALSGASILSNDTDVDGDVLSVASVNGSIANVGAQIVLASGALLEVSDDGSFTYDPNGAFDGLNGGQTAFDSFTYTATDGNADSNSETVTISISGVDMPPLSTGTAIGQSGVVTVSQAGPNQWHQVIFDAVIADAVVVMGPVSSADADPVTTRVRNVTDTGFEFQIDEWDYLDGVHGAESIGWLAVSEGAHRLDSGQTIVAATASIGTARTAVSFGQSLTDAVVLTEITTANQEDALVTRVRGADALGFDLRLQEEEAGNTGAQAAIVNETVSWIAIEAGRNAAFEAFLTPDEVAENAISYSFASDFLTAPVLLADMQTTDGRDPATTRLSSLDASTAALFVEEEQSSDVEMRHGSEVLGVVALSGGLLFRESAPNRAPVGQDDVAEVLEGAQRSIDVLANDVDADGDVLIVTQVDSQEIGVGQTITLASGARVTLNGDQSLHYDQNGAFDALQTGQTSQDQFSYALADSEGALSGATVTVTINGLDTPEPSVAIGQSGTASVRQETADQWHFVAFDTAIQNAVVVMGPATSDDDDPLTTRVRNVTDSGFEFQLDEWDYLDGVHGSESIGWLALSEGTHVLSTGQTVVAATASVGTSFSTLSFGGTLSDAVVFAEVNSVNGPDAVTTRIRNVSEQGFQVQIEEEEAGGAHLAETVAWIAIESGQGNGQEALRADALLNHVTDTFVFSQSFTEAPVLIADMQTTNGGDSATLRLTDLGPNEMSMFVEEERSANSEINHAEEAIGYIALDEGLIFLDSFLI